MVVKPNEIAFEKRYSDDSGVEFGVRLTNDAIQFEAVNTVEFPPGQLEWLIECLDYIRRHGEL